MGEMVCKINKKKKQNCAICIKDKKEDEKAQKKFIINNEFEKR